MSKFGIYHYCCYINIFNLRLFRPRCLWFLILCGTSFNLWGFNGGIKDGMEVKLYLDHWIGGYQYPALIVNEHVTSLNRKPDTPMFTHTHTHARTHARTHTHTHTHDW